MTNEEMQRMMEFILNQQGQFVMDIAKLESKLAGLTEKLDGLTEKLDGLTGVVAQLATATLNRFEEVDRKIEALVDAQIRTEENLAKTSDGLRSLIAVVDRYFSEGRNGQ